MFDRLIGFFSWLMCIDAFQSIRTREPWLNEKRKLERSIIVALAGSVVLLAAAFGLAPAAVPEPLSLNDFAAQFRTYVSMAAFAAAVAALAFVVVQWIRHWKHTR